MGRVPTTRLDSAFAFRLGPQDHTKVSCDLPTTTPPPPPLPQVREELGLPLNIRLAVLIHGGHKAELDVREDFLPPGWVCVACNGGRPLGPHPLPPNFMLAPADVYTPDLVEASDCILGKIGYG